MRFRIGINLGDVMVEESDIFGDGVNVAARLQELAEPGGILISGPVYDQVHNKLSIAFDSLGYQQVKNVTTPIMSYRVIQGGAKPPQSKPQVQTSDAIARSESRVGTMLARLWGWYLDLPRSIAAIVAIIGFLFLINVFSGLDDIWFHWPAAPLLLIVVLWAVLRRKPS